MNADKVIALARKHLGSGVMESSARLALADAITLRDQGKLTEAKARALHSLAYSVGGFHADYKKASAKIPRVDAGDYEDREFSPVQHEMNRVSRRKNNPVENRDNATQAIVTKYIPASNTRSSRVKATTASGISITVPWDGGLDTYANHVAAAEALQTKMKWGGDMVGGATKDGYAFTFRETGGTHKGNPAPLTTRQKRGIAGLKRMAQEYADETGVSFVVTKSGEIHPATGHKYSDEVASVKPRAKNPAPKSSVAVGDTVKYKAAFLRSTGMYTGPIPFARGVITSIQNDVAVIAWNHPDIPAHVLTFNLEKARAKNPAPKRGKDYFAGGYAIYARKGAGPRVFYDDTKFTNNGEPLYFDTKKGARDVAAKLLSWYPILREYVVTVEPYPPKLMREMRERRAKYLGK